MVMAALSFDEHILPNRNPTDMTSWTGTWIHCRGCNRDLRELTVFHVRDCTNKQARMDEYL